MKTTITRVIGLLRLIQSLPSEKNLSARHKRRCLPLLWSHEQGQSKVKTLSCPLALFNGKIQNGLRFFSLVCENTSWAIQQNPRRLSALHSLWGSAALAWIVQVCPPSVAATALPFSLVMSWSSWGLWWNVLGLGY